MSTGLVQISNGDENAAVNVNKSGKSKPLQASTNIIHTKTPRRIDNLIYDKSRQLPGKKLNDQLKKTQAPTSSTRPSDLKASHALRKSENDVGQKSSSKKKTTTTTPVKKIDENGVSAMVKNSYNPLDDVYQFDEVLFQKVMSLKCADDGIPAFDYSEPFDF